MDRLGIGIDFGTTNSAAAVFDGEAVRFISIDGEETIMPSATYIDTSLQTTTGSDAIARYVTDNTGRTVELVPEIIGQASIAVGAPDPEGRRSVDTLTQNIYGKAMQDTGLQGRLFRGTKRLLGNSDVRRLMVFDQPFRLVALITPILLRIKHGLEKTGFHTTSGYVGHPVNFEGRQPGKNDLALSRLGEAYGYAGIKRHRFYPEPIAAAVSFLKDHPEASGRTVMTVDFGGGTLDFCILRRDQGNTFEVLTTHGIALGGDHIDQRIFRRLLFPLLGKGERWHRRGTDRMIETAFPFEDYEDLLLNWTVTYLLNQNKYTTPVLEKLKQGDGSSKKFRRLRELIQQNLSYIVFQRIKEFKAELSSVEEAVLDIPEIDIRINVTRSQFEDLISDLLNQVNFAVQETLEKANLVPSDIDIVLRTGGSSLIPAVHRMLDERFTGRVVDHDPFTSVAAGLAIADYENSAS